MALHPDKVHSLSAKLKPKAKKPNRDAMIRAIAEDVYHSRKNYLSKRS